MSAQPEAIALRTATPADAEWLQRGFAAALRWEKPAGYFAGVIQQQAQGAVVLLLATTVAASGEAGVYVGHVKLVWQPDYAPLRQAGIPEIQDLMVVPSFRRQGVATRLIARCEQLAATRSTHIGIGVGLYADYGPAQRLYVTLGFVPDGHGVTYDDAVVPPGTDVPLDDALVLHFTKRVGRR